MKRAPFPGLAGVVAFAVLLLAGCSSYSSHTAGPGPAAKKNVFVLSNPNDNNNLDNQIVEDLKARGYVADCGPLTMMPDDTQVVVIYEDHWNWDFGDHLTYLQLTAKDRRTGQTYASANFQAKIPSKKSAGKVIHELLDRLIADAKAKR